MHVTHKNGRKWVTLDPGDHFVSKENLIMSTLLGSCVSACLYDPVNRIAGMNHFLLSNRRYSKELPIFQSEAGRYGIHAMELLINKMIHRGANKRYIKAKAFGGGNVLPTINKDNFFCVGKVNSKFILDYLELENIPLESHSLGGETGRVIRFDTHDFAVYSRKIQRITDEKKIYEKEHTYWEKTIIKQKEEETNIDLW